MCDDDDDNLTTLELIRKLKARGDLTVLELRLLDKLDMAMDEIALLEREVARHEQRLEDAS